VFTADRKGKAMREEYGFVLPIIRECKIKVFEG
jgi:hypothetical protein